MTSHPQPRSHSHSHNHTSLPRRVPSISALLTTPQFQENINTSTVTLPPLHHVTPPATPASTPGLQSPPVFRSPGMVSPYTTNSSPILTSAATTTLRPLRVKQYSFASNPNILPPLGGSHGAICIFDRCRRRCKCKCKRRGKCKRKCKHTPKHKCKHKCKHNRIDRPPTPPEQTPALKNSLTPTSKPEKPKSKRRRTTTKEWNILLNEFNKNPNPNKIKRIQLSQQCNMTEKTVQIWFQNRRQANKKLLLKNNSASPTSSLNSGTNGPNKRIGLNFINNNITTINIR
ncbi:hypothetical protein TBLA_0D01390 [Henningerozyma blattae CBS 6284]|uniref:Homeobox domain-containing protein n=1 Tax=Henningerozyma blattae (strain ATCC 34711 / CBS 6284 / DSM 70876 / NBRC 10599 / NRRL Y-10934 / UCD 77-7) TaxID=1071380 RepID=I2H2P4_HENB6|nr:hypothetical protein TBLA_0D01390 [Tetrapisispora blattae CBS 6284]CCH60646.1 hypothetical protein TBLA_0D01390 [Tetrapisispora blattae CBS 6284]